MIEPAEITRSAQRPYDTDDCDAIGRLESAAALAAGTGTALVCMLAKGHEGDHYDELDKVWWRRKVEPTA